MRWTASMPQPAANRTSEAIRSGQRKDASAIASGSSIAKAKEVNPRSAQAVLDQLGGEELVLDDQRVDQPPLFRIGEGESRLSAAESQSYARRYQ